jgi:hypothetical protein
LKSPLGYDGDALLIMPMVKSTLETGTHWRIERMGWPGVLELHDFPVIDHLHFAIIWLIGRLISDWCVVYNAYYLLGYPLTTLTGMYAFRRLGLSLSVSALGGLLYAFTPYHYMRGEAHYFLSAYWLIPLAWLPAFAICKGCLPFFRSEPGGTLHFAPWRKNSIGLVVLMAATSAGGAYYAFFTCAIYGFVGFYQSLVSRSVKPLVSAVVLCGLITAFGVANHLPVVPYAMKNGRANVTDRTAGEAEAYGMKLAQLVLPADSHNFTPFGHLKARYNGIDRPLQNENTASTMGLIATIGFFILLAKLFLPRSRDWPYGPLAAVNAFILLYATIGGFSSLFNLMVFEQIRCPNRISIFLVFLCLFVPLRILDRFLAARSARVRYLAVAAIAFLGIADQTPTPWFTSAALEAPNYYAAHFDSDRRFFGRIEEVMPPGAKIFNCPYIAFPEVLDVHKMGTYSHARGYLHTTTLKWMYATMKNRETDVWYESVSHDAPAQILRRLVVRGFDGVVIDKRGFESVSSANAVINNFRLFGEVGGRVRMPMFENDDHTLTFLDLRPYRDWYQAQDPVRFEQEAADEREFVSFCWINGFESYEGYGLRNNLRWGYRKNLISIVNPSDRVRRFKFTADVGTDFEGEFTITIDGGAVGWNDAFALEKPDLPQGSKPYMVRKEYVLEIPPGRHFVKVYCRQPWHFIPGDSKAKMFYLMNIQFNEVK